jgi:hypothetical protein
MKRRCQQNVTNKVRKERNCKINYFSNWMLIEIKEEVSGEFLKTG